MAGLSRPGHGVYLKDCSGMLKESPNPEITKRTKTRENNVKIDGILRPREPMRWEIHGRSMDKSRVFGNPDFGEKSRFENKLAVFRKVLKVCGFFLPMLWH